MHSEEALQWPPTAIPANLRLRAHLSGGWYMIVIREYDMALIWPNAKGNCGPQSQIASLNCRDWIKM